MKKNDLPLSLLPLSGEATAIISATRPSGPIWLTEKQVHALTGISTSALQKARHFRAGIPYCKIGKSIRYMLADVEQFMSSTRINPAE